MASAASVLEAVSAYASARSERAGDDETPAGDEERLLRRRLFDYFYESGGALLCQSWVRIGGRPILVRDGEPCYFCPNGAQVFRGLWHLGAHYARRVINCPRCGVVADVPWSSDAPRPSLDGARLHFSNLPSRGAGVAVLREARLRSRRLLTPWPVGDDGSSLPEMDLAPLLEQGTNTWLAVLVSSGLALFVYRVPLLAPAVAG